jgi:hypothetical protein
LNNQLMPAIQRRIGLAMNMSKMAMPAAASATHQNW